MRLIVWLFLISLAQIAVAQESLPSDAELRSAYCIPVLEWQIDLYGKMVVAIDSWEKNANQASVSDQAHKKVAELTSALDRLRMYLLPRMQYRDPIAIVGAQKRGEADVQAFKTMTGKCTTQCVAGGRTVPADDKERACMESCKDKTLVARINACETPSWLPF